MKILGINISHHSSSCLLKDGKILYFIEDERINRIKGHNIIYHSKDHLIHKTYNPCFMDKLKTYTSHVDYVIFSSYGSAYHTNHPFSDENIIELYLSSFKKNGISFENVIFKRENHHIYHASNGFYGSGFDDAICLILDGGGSLLENFDEFKIQNYENNIFREVESIFEFSYDSAPKKIMQLFAMETDDYDSILSSLTDDNNSIIYNDGVDIVSTTWSVGNLFNILCYAVGFEKHGNDAGKMMGLPSYVEYENEKKYNFEKLDWFLDSGGHRITSLKFMRMINNFCKQSYKYFDKNDFEKNFQLKCRISKKLHDESLKHTNYLITKALEKSSSRNLVISGGYALNCLNNYQYLNNLPKDVKIYIDPISNDSGTALGAAKMLWYELSGKKEKDSLTSLYLG